MDVVRAWRDPIYRSSLSAEEQEALPEHPSGIITLSDPQMGQVNGGTYTPVCAVTAVICNTITMTVCNGSCSSFSVGCCG